MSHLELTKLDVEAILSDDWPQHSQVSTINVDTYIWHLIFCGSSLLGNDIVLSPATSSENLQLIDPHPFIWMVLLHSLQHCSAAPRPTRLIVFRIYFSKFEVGIFWVNSDLARDCHPAKKLPVAEFLLFWYFFCSVLELLTRAWASNWQALHLTISALLSHHSGFD